MAGPRDHLVWVDPQPGPRRAVRLVDLWTEVGIDPAQVYRTWDAGFGARLTHVQVARLSDRAEVRDVTPDAPGRPAPYRRASAGVPGSYLVRMQPGTDPVAAARRVGVTPTGLYRLSFVGFAATMSSAELELVRRDPEVVWVMDDLPVG